MDQQTPPPSDQPLIAPKPMDEVALIAAIDDADNRSYGSNLSNLTAELSAQRALAIDLYLGKNVDPAPEGQSNVVDRTVFETVQWILPSLCRIFANGDDVVTLLPLGPQDVDQAKQETAYLNWLVTVKHSWFDQFLEFATDCLLTKNAYWLVYKDNNRQVDIEKYEDQTKMGIAFLLQDPTCQLISSQAKAAPDMPPDPVLGPDGQPVIDANGQPMTTPALLYDVTVRRVKNQKDICLRVLPPERCKVDQRAFNWRLDDRCGYFEYWEEMTLTELREQGYEISTDIADDPEIYTQEDYARDQFGERRLERYKPADPSMRRVKARMIWIRVDADGDGIAELLQITRVGRHILYKEEVSRIPVASGVACPLPHRHVGVGIGDMVADIQRIKTFLMRQGLDGLYASNYPQKVLNENFVNMDDVMIRRPDGVIRATDINQIRYEQVPFVFPQVVEGLQYMDQVRESRTGVNNGFSGIGTADLMESAQPGTVNQMTSMAAQRVEQIARILAFAIEDLFSIVHEQVLKMGHKRQVVQLLGNWVEVDPGGWQRRTDFKACVAFSSGNKDAQVSRLMVMLQKQAEALTTGIPVCTPENYYNTLVELTKAADFAQPERFWTDPAKAPPKPPPPPPEQIVVAQINSEKDKQIKAAEIAQREVESQRKMAMDKYAIDSNAGLDLINKQIEHGHEVAMQQLKAGHEATLSALDNKLTGITNAGAKVNAALDNATEGMAKHTADIGKVHSALNETLEHVKHIGKLATGRKVVRKNDKGEVDGVDVVDHEGKVLQSHKAIKDKDGRITGMQ
jgi:hypothetical protein